MWIHTSTELDDVGYCAQNKRRKIFNNTEYAARRLCSMNTAPFSSLGCSSVGIWMEMRILDEERAVFKGRGFH